MSQHTLSLLFLCLLVIRISGAIALTEGEAEQLLLQSTGATEQRVSVLQTVLAPAFASLPKNNIGRLEWPGARQLVNRHFTSEQGWHIKGLEPHRNPNVTEDLLKKGRILGDMLPRKLLQPLQQYLANGCTLRGSAVLVAILEHVGADDGVASLPHLKASYRFNTLTTNSSLSDSKLEKVIDSAMILFIEGGNLSDTARHHLIRQKMNLIYPGWKKTQDFAHRVVRDFVQKHGNGSSLSFSGVHEALEEIGLRYGKFQEVDCLDMKSILMDMDPLRTGRVPLSDFYGRKDAWQFSESVEYMRSLGVLDESDSRQGAQVIISNYLTSDNNCLAKSKHQNVCCLHECDALLGAVEAKVLRPMASPTEVLSIVESISSASTPAPRILSPLLKEALLQIAGLHSGKVPLHGRLFSQWLHYAFPHECPFPQLTESVVSMTPEEWGQHFHRSSRATPWQMQAGVRAGHALLARHGHEGRPMPLPLPQWSLQEELLAGSADDAAVDPWAYALADPTSYTMAAGLAAVGMLLLVCAVVMRSGRNSFAKEDITADAGSALLKA